MSSESEPVEGEAGARLIVALLAAIAQQRALQSRRSRR